MSRRYTPEEKAEALRQIDANFGSISLASIATGIPERTLRHWRRQQHLLPEKNVRRQQQDPSEDQPHEFSTLRDDLMQHIFDLSASLSEHDEHINLRVIALARLLDRVMKLDAHLAQIAPHKQVVRIEYKYPDGTIHNVPVWENDEYADLVMRHHPYSPWDNEGNLRENPPHEDPAGGDDGT